MSIPSKSLAAAISPLLYTDRELHHSPYTRIVQNFRLIWFDGSRDEVNSNDWSANIFMLRCIINTIDTFTDVDKCIQFLTYINDERVFLCLIDHVAEHIIPILHDMSQLDSIYILSRNKLRHEQLTKQWWKVRGVFTEVSTIFHALEKATKQCDQNSISIDVIPAIDDPSNQNLDQLDQSFMYTQLIKEILLTIDFDETHIKSFTEFCRKQFAGNHSTLSVVNELEQKYHERTPIGWYTYGSFLFSMLNRALRLMDIDIVIKMAFFIKDLHCQIAELHHE
jgi:hypothetical protein